MIRDVELDGCLVRIGEDNTLDNESGIVVWDAALVLIHYLSLLSRQTQGAFLRGKRVLDLGCGTGVAGLSAAALGAAAVTLTDFPHLLPLAERNIQLNHLQGIASAAVLQWGEPETHLQPPIHLILASDVLYQADAIPALIATLRELSGPDTLTLISHEHREKLPFPQAQIQAAGFAVQQVAQHELHPEWTSDDIAVYRLALLPARTA